MAYDWTQLGVKEITNLFSYGDISTPSDRINDSIIRPVIATKLIDVNMASFMATGPGRFALGAQSAMVEAFFSTATDLSWMIAGVKYTKADIIAHLGLAVQSDQINIKQVELNDLSGDYWARSYIWNSGLFKLYDAATFSVDASGNRSIGNYSIRPFNDNFDFDGGGLIAGIANFVLEPQVDPWGIGREVKLNFVDNGLPTKTYTNADYSADVVKHANHVVLGGPSILTLPAGAFSIFNDLWTSGVTQTIYQGKPIIYGTNGAETLSAGQLDALPLLSPLRIYGKSDPNKGVALIAGGGNDTLNGGVNADYLQGGADADVLTGGLGRDALDGGLGFDTYLLNPGDGFDTVLDSDGLAVC